jgi:hypothetical protein
MTRDHVRSSQSKLPNSSALIMKSASPVAPASCHILPNNVSRTCPVSYPNPRVHVRLPSDHKAVSPCNTYGFIAWPPNKTNHIHRDGSGGRTKTHGTPRDVTPGTCSRHNVSLTGPVSTQIAIPTWNGQGGRNSHNTQSLRASARRQYRAALREDEGARERPVPGRIGAACAGRRRLAGAGCQSGAARACAPRERRVMDAHARLGERASWSRGSLSRLLDARSVPAAAIACLRRRLLSTTPCPPACRAGP